MKKISLFFSIVIFIGCLSCSDQTALDHALHLSGNNRTELEKVLEYYSKDEKDSLKLKAAIFLIENMPFHHYLELSEKELLYQKELYPLTTEGALGPSQAMDSLEKKYGRMNNPMTDYKNDLETITAEYLIANIEYAFRAWERAPWKKYISFRQFCEEILPYRVSSEPLDAWRETYYNYFSPILDSLLMDDDPVSAANIIYDVLLQKRWILNRKAEEMPLSGANYLLNGRFGTCMDACNLVACALRSVAIPSGVDLFLKNPSRGNNTHSWNYMKDTTGRSLELSLLSDFLRPSLASKGDTTRKKGIIYRLYYDARKESLPVSHPGKEIPASLKNPFILDVTNVYFPGTQLKIPVDEKSRKDDLLYLGVFHANVWEPVAWAEIDHGEALFRGMEPGVIFCPLYYKNGKIIPASAPFILQENNELRYFVADTDHPLDSMVVRRKYLLLPVLEELRRRSLNGRFEGANRPDFKDAVTLYTIREYPELIYQDICIDPPSMFRYMRYYPDQTSRSRCNMAEIEFFGDRQEELSGEIIGVEGSFKDLKDRTKQKAFDKDPLTFFEANGNTEGWIGLDFGRAQPVSRIRYLYRNDDNNIREGDRYELFYYAKDRWVSLGSQTGDKGQRLVYYHVPDRALYWLRNYTRGREESVFTYENGIQVFW